MSARPGEWHLLGVDADPLPGDEAAVHRSSGDYTEISQAIHEQVYRLRTMAQGTNQLVGEFAPSLRDAAGELAEHLERAEDRFDTVATQLGIWDPVLDNGRVESGSLLRQAVAAQDSADANRPPLVPVDPTDQAAADADGRRADRLSAAEGELTRIRTAFHTLMSQVDSTAQRVAHAIEEASDDQLKDSWWDSHVRKWIHDHADLLKFIADVLTWIATAIIIAVVLLSNPAGWLLLVAMIATAAALVIHTVLAANGDGSWVDVALDAFALVTMGAGKLLSEGARGAFATRMGVEGFSESTSAARAAFSQAEGFGAKAPGSARATSWPATCAVPLRGSPSSTR